MKSGLLFPKALVWLWTVCTWGGEGEGGKGGGTSKGLKPEFALSGTVCFSKTYLKQFYKHGLLSGF